MELLFHISSFLGLGPVIHTLLKWLNYGCLINNTTACIELHRIKICVTPPKLRLTNAFKLAGYLTLALHNTYSNVCIILSIIYNVQSLIQLL